MSVNLPARARVLIVGGGVVGVAVAYHLARRGVPDVVLVERRALACGTTWHAAGLVGKLRGDWTVTALAQESADLYAKLSYETGVDTGLRLPGTLNVADSDGLMTEYRRLASLGQRCGLEAQVLGVEAIAERCPVLNVEGLVGGVFLPDDGQVDPVGLTQALAKGARNHGAIIVENCRVTELRREGRRVVGAHTSLGDIEAETVALTAGMWTRELAATLGASVPLAACEHYYIVTEPVANLPENMPVVRDVGARAYYKADAGKILLGCFEAEARPWGLEGIGEDFCFDELPGEFAQFEPTLEKAMHRLPLLQKAGIRTFFCGPESFTPDDRMLLGRLPEADNVFVAAGMNSIGIQTAGGVGRVLADWMSEGVPPRDLGRVDVARMMPFQRNREYLRARVRESLGLLYSVHWPYKQPESARGARRSPLHGELAAAGACFGEAAGWERANWFCPDKGEGGAPRYEYAFGRQNWFLACAAECRAAREAGVVDLSSFAKFKVCGADACAFLNRVCANEVDVAVGKIVYTPWLNERGGMEADLTVTRLAVDEFLVLAGVMSQRRDMGWMRRHVREGERVALFDATSAFAGIGLFGRRAAEVLAAAGAGAEAVFEYGTAREVEVGFAPALALRIGYAGEAGYELLVPAEFAGNAYAALMRAGEESGGVGQVGMHAVDAMRMEKARRHFGDDLTSEDTPVEAGLGFAVAWDKRGGFVGREALLPQRFAARERRLKKRLVQVALAAGAEAPLMFGDEPILRDGEVVGGVTSAAFGHRVGLSLALGYARFADGVTNAWCEAGRWEVEIAGVRHEARWLARPPYDADNAALRAGF